MDSSSRPRDMKIGRDQHMIISIVFFTKFFDPARFLPTLAMKIVVNCCKNPLGVETFQNLENGSNDFVHSLRIFYFDTILKDLRSGFF